MLGDVGIKPEPVTRPRVRLRAVASHQDENTATPCLLGDRTEHGEVRETAQLGRLQAEGKREASERQARITVSERDE